MKGVLFLLILFSLNAQGETFKELIKRVEDHPMVLANLNESKAIGEMAEGEGSWGDPQLMVAAMNFPQDSLSRNESMMTGIQVGISQKLSLSGKYAKMRESLEAQSDSQAALTNQLKRRLYKELWSLAITKEKLVQEKEVLNESFQWVSQNLKITKRLYSTGKVAQQAVLDMQMRKSELSAQIGQKEYELKGIKHRLASLLGSERSLGINLKSVPWNSLDKWKSSEAKTDFQLESLKHQLKATELKLSAKQRDYFPDVTFGLSYTKRNNIDGLGDFVGASFSIPLPTSDKRYAASKEALHQRVKAEQTYRNYLLAKPNILNQIKLEIEDIENQLNIIKTQTLRFAKSSRDVTAKSYSRGGSDYLELLRSELQYQNQLLKKVLLLSQLKMKKVDYLFVKGDDLTHGEKS